MTYALLWVAWLNAALNVPENDLQRSQVHVASLGMEPDTAYASNYIGRTCLDKAAHGNGSSSHGSSSSSAGVPPATVGVRVLAPASVTAGETVLCRIRVYNRSPVAVYYVEVRNRISSPVEVLTTMPQTERRDGELVWRLDRLRPGETRELTLQLRANQEGALRQCVRVRYEHGVCVETEVRPRAPSLGQAHLELRKEGPTQVLAGSSVPVRLLVSNRGTAPAEDVVVVDELPAGLEHADGGQRLSFYLGRIPPGSQRVLEYRLIARRTGQWTNHAYVRARDGLEAFASQVITVAAPQLAIQLEATPQTASGADFPVRIIVSNASELALRQIQVEYLRPSAADVVQVEPPASITARAVSWTISQLRPGEKVLLQLGLRGNQPGVVEHFATARVAGSHATARAKTEIFGAASLLLVVVDSDDPILVGQDTRYQIIVRNQGSAPATNIRLKVEVPGELAITRVQGPSDHKRDGQTLLFEPLNLPANTDRMYRVYVRALKPGVVRLRVEITADPLRTGPVRAEESTTVLNGP
ncbi:MAG: hypothetical protein RMI91_10585 [Gemmatales bacterium]|nr:DUF11 domain-containing protein [Gemmatales bacterium]MDW7995089.1 hypothetical protein [Gemmatales bacterium]